MIRPVAITLCGSDSHCDSERSRTLRREMRAPVALPVVNCGGCEDELAPSAAAKELILQEYHVKLDGYVELLFPPSNAICFVVAIIDLFVLPPFRLFLSVSSFDRVSYPLYHRRCLMINRHCNYYG
jgi:hypothetical protein